MNFYTKISVFTFIQFLSVSMIAQEMERDLIFVPTGQERGGGETSFRDGAPAMSLPFIDDFAWPSFYEESGENNIDLVRWDTSPVRRTQTMSINAPTFGVATLDGMDSGGYPYNFNSVDAHGWADTLTSRKLYLDGMTADDGVTLSFWFQGGGIGNAPDENQDSLIVEFKSVGLEGDIWTQVWGTTGTDEDEFTQVVLSVENGEYLHSSFQFRFRNYGSLMGNTDLWHIDYVYVAANGATGNPVEELAFNEPAYTLLRNYSAMPWTHFSENPAFYMRDSLVIESTNFGTGPNNQENTGITVRHKVEGGVPVKYTNQFIQNVSVPVGVFTTEYLSELEDENEVPSELVFDTSVSDSVATFEVSLWQEEVGFNTNQTTVFDNDSIGYDQVFDSFYAYDDGTAEKAYALDAIGGELAVRFPLAIADTLDGVLIHFTPFYDNASEETFVLKVWEDDAGVPGEMLDTMYQFHNPFYFTEGYDLFAYYPFDNPIPVSGTIHVGLIQQEVDRLNIGLDKNSNSNAGNLHFKLGNGFDWAPSSIEGSLMLRPVLRAGTESVVDIVEVENPTLITSPYPNPTSSELNFGVIEEVVWDIFDTNGRLMQSGREQAGNSNVNVQGLANGIYILQVRQNSGKGLEHHRFIIQR